MRTSCRAPQPCCSAYPDTQQTCTPLSHTAACTAINQEPYCHTCPGQSPLLPASALAAKQLFLSSGRPQYAQAFVELCLERALLDVRQAGPALASVLQAYRQQGDLQGVSATSVCYSTCMQGHLQGAVVQHTCTRAVNASLAYGGRYWHVCSTAKIRGRWHLGHIGMQATGQPSKAQWHFGSMHKGSRTVHD